MPEPKSNPLSMIWSALRARTKPKSTVAVVRGRPDARQWSPELLRQLEWRRFEELCVAYYEAVGFHTRLTQATAGGGVDIHLSAQDGKPTATIVHCKAWDAYRVGVKALRELRAALGAATVAEGVLITAGRFTHEAAALAPKEGIQLIDGPALLAKFAALPAEKSLALLKLATQGDFVTPTCPVCSVKMTSRQSTREGRKFWGCINYPRCKHTLSGTLTAPA